MRLFENGGTLYRLKNECCNYYFFLQYSWYPFQILQRRIFPLKRSPNIFALCETNLNSSTGNNEFLVPGYLPLFQKDSSIHIHGLSVYIRDNLSMARELFLEVTHCSFMCFPFSLLNYVSYLCFLYRIPSSQDCSILDAIAYGIEKALHLHPSANIFVFDDFDTHHNAWLKYSKGIDVAGIQTLNFSIAQSLIQIVDFPTRFPS